ncbi:unnamed protein product (macronuclear) [Paramecium tetraurelia]|uniref:Uncharacterized protein n=1 Tax=Paramecium tetraurelia TaxID=5888 RepID=A0BFH4_PARTE|nr:uncharacterized protein GSPATT00028326001 [Paramecium tetraurelia]CAK57291.1 unnamed protein product [Paramecium tetraurelia]|eukprot:XP_001424689.1 hypothetical protein (macronuclear) [Paramecium tetraurelia strain d4-2]
MSKTTYHPQFQCSSPVNDEELLSVKKSFDSEISIYNPENELQDMNQAQKGFSQLFDDYGYIVFRNGDLEKQKSIQIIDNESFAFIEEEDNSLNLFHDQYSESKQKYDPIKIKEEPPQRPKKFLDKNFCRYILLYAFRTIENNQFAETISSICSQFQFNYNDFIQYYTKQRVLIMGYQALKKELIYDGDSIQNQNRKKAFKEVLVWYLNTLATKQILSSKKQNIKDYLKFKNYVMLYNIHNPKAWTGNKIQWN